MKKGCFCGSKFLFSVEKNFSKGKYSIQQSEFFPFPDFAHGALTYVRAYCRVVGGLYIACVGCQRGCEAGGGGLKSHYRPYFLHIFRHSVTRSDFFTAKKQDFLDKI